MEGGNEELKNENGYKSSYLQAVCHIMRISAPISGPRRKFALSFTFKRQTMITEN